MTLDRHLLSHNIPLDTTKIHVIREPNASLNWQSLTTLEYSNIEDVTLLETACNKASRWKNCTHVAVLIDCNVPNSPYTGFKKSYFFIGVLGVQGRADGFSEDDCGTFDNPAWKLEWQWIDKQFLFRNENLPSRGYHFHAQSGTSASADQFFMVDIQQACTDEERFQYLTRALRWIAYTQFGVSDLPMKKFLVFVNNFASLFSDGFDFEEFIRERPNLLNGEPPVPIDLGVLSANKDLTYTNQSSISVWALYFLDMLKTKHSQNGFVYTNVWKFIEYTRWNESYKGTTPWFNVSRDLSNSPAVEVVGKNGKANGYTTNINEMNSVEFLGYTDAKCADLSQTNSEMYQLMQPIIELRLPEQQINAMYRLPDEHFLQEMINCHVDGITVEELIKSIRLRGSYSQAYLETVPGQLNKGYHFFGLDGDVLVDNDVSQSYASGDTDPLMVTAFQNFYLFAEVLEWMSRNPNQRIGTIIEEVNAHYPSWNSPMQATIRVWWLRFFELVSPSVEVNLKGKKLSITDKGTEVLRRIDFTDREMIGSRPKIKKFVEEFKESNFQDILKTIKENTQDQKIVVDEDELKDIHNGFHANSEKRFIILSGLSGTGKTKMLQEYARAYCELQDLEYEAHVFPVAVTPAFRDHTLLLGYLNPLTEPPRYIEGEITALLREAADTPHLPYFLILDEMNLARVEFYLAPILSSMESDEGVVFHNSDDVDFPQRIKQWPSNIFMAGTVNMDETTHAFSDKVLDRAFTMEFWDINLATYFEQSPTDVFVQDTITNVYNALKPAHLHFGYRTVKAIVDYVDRAVETDTNDQKRALDQAIFSKVLPKLKGQKTALLTKALDEMLKVCAVLSRKSVETEKSKTLNKLTQMQARLKDTGLTRFWR